MTVAEPALWSPAQPEPLRRSRWRSASESSYAARVGLRQLTWHGGHVYLNGQRLLLHGASIQEDARGHGDALTPADEDTIVGELQAIDANAVRSQHPLDPALLERLDAAGILVWQGVGPVEGAGNWYSTTPRLLAEAEQQARTAVLAGELHPSIFAWNLVDEIAGNGRDSAEVAVRRSRSPTGCTPATRGAWSAWTCGATIRRRARRARSTADVDAIAETDYTRLV